MSTVLVLLVTLAVWLPALAFAEGGEVGGTYRGIAGVYYALIWIVLSYGLYDSFGRKALYVGAPILALVFYFILPSA
ncbi:MAG TPA: hypothetical protein VFS39_03485 [Nitrospira sp.]|nr:hypothetical protein [Nitrospira sp.]